MLLPDNFSEKWVWVLRKTLNEFGTGKVNKTGTKRALPSQTCPGSIPSEREFPGGKNGEKKQKRVASLTT